MSSNNNHRQHGGKRNYHSGKNKSKYQPKRGGPGIIITCESGRDFKAKREGIEILRYYYNLAKGNTGSNDEIKDQPAATELAAGKGKPEGEPTSEDPPKRELTLEDELNQLKSENALDKSAQHHSNRGRRHGPFAVYDTGCKGTIFVMCTAPDCSFIPKLKNLKDGAKGKEGGDDDHDEPSNKKAKTVPTEEESQLAPSEETKKQDTNEGNEIQNVTAKWDPVNTIRSVLGDIQKELDTGKTNPEIPSSRFISRMIPMQATCFASIEEITATFRLLLEHVTLPKIEKQKAHQKSEAKSEGPISFGIKFKKRNCGNVTRDQVIDGIVLQVDEATNEGWKVNLDKPDYRVEVQICKTLCGMSILAATGEDAFMTSRNFNLAELRVEAASTIIDPETDNQNDGE